jgi:hypothetical protein
MASQISQNSGDVTESDLRCNTFKKPEKSVSVGTEADSNANEQSGPDIGQDSNRTTGLLLHVSMFGSRIREKGREANQGQNNRDRKGWLSSWTC